MRKLLAVSLLIVGVVISYGALRAVHSGQRIVSHTGSIEGQVVDAEGQPVAGVRVYAFRDDFVKGILPAFYTDEHGKFLIKNLTAGIYTVQATKEQDGYPDTDSPFLSGPITPPRVNVVDQQTTRGVIVQLGPKISRLVGRVMDAVTHRSIINAKIIISRVDNPTIKSVTDLDQSEAKLSPNIRLPPAARANGTFNIPVPSAEIKIKVSALGYEDWYYNEGSNEKSDILYLAPNTTKEIIIRLRPINR
jgi:Carboxypeptidase regulatory-like domain